MLTDGNRASEQQLVDYAKLALGAPANIDGTVVAGGTVDEIPLEEAAFIVPEADEEEAPPAEEPPAEEPAGETTAVEEVPAEETGVEEVPAEEVPAEETPVVEAPAEEAAPAA